MAVADGESRIVDSGLVAPSMQSWDSGTRLRSGNAAGAGALRASITLSSCSHACSSMSRVPPLHQSTLKHKILITLPKRLQEGSRHARLEDTNRPD